MLPVTMFVGRFTLRRTKRGHSPLEMRVCNWTTLPKWGRTRAKYPQARALAYADDGYIKSKMSVALQVLADLKHVLKEDSGLDLNVSKTSILAQGISQ